MNRLLLAVLLSCPSSVFAQVRTVTVTGSASVPVVPDVANVSYSFINELRLDAAGGATLTPSLAAIETPGAAPSRQALTAPRKKKAEPAQAAQATLPEMVAENRARVAPAVAHIKSIVGDRGTVEVLPSVERQVEYNEKTRRQELVGYRIVTNIQVKLEGRDAIEQKLGDLFDSSRIKADEIGEPNMGLTETTQKQATREAYRLAVQDAVDTANSQLEQGETLGAALQRGDRIHVPSPEPRAMRAMASMESAGGSRGQAVVETGKITVQAVIHFVFEVAGAPVRLGVQAAQGK